MPEWSKGADCNSAISHLGSNPSGYTNQCVARKGNRPALDAGICRFESYRTDQIQNISLSIVIGFLL